MPVLFKITKFNLLFLNSNFNVCIATRVRHPFHVELNQIFENDKNRVEMNCGLQTLGRNCVAFRPTSFIWLWVWALLEISVIPSFLLRFAVLLAEFFFSISIRLSFPLDFISFSLPIISYNVFAADWQKSLLLSLLLGASRGYKRGVIFCRDRTMAV